MSRAVVDVSGSWVVRLQVAPTVSVAMTMTQEGTSLTATIGIGIDPSLASGTIDPATGVFTLRGVYTVRPGIPEAPPVVSCRYTITATASADGQRFAGTHDDDCGLRTGVSGVRQQCGNGVVDPGEPCDAALPCCTATCQLAPAGTACPDEGNPCTDDLCDAAGSCRHTPNTAPCSATGCTSDTCSGGTCMPGGPLPAGSSCPDDVNPCTSEACDGAGGCQHVPLAAGTSCANDAGSCTLHACDGAGRCVATPVQCPLCETCFGGQCVATPAILCADASVGSLLDLRIHAPGKERLLWRWLGRTATFPVPGTFGDPRADAQYALCVFLTSPLIAATAGTTLPPGGSCAGGPCWSALEDGFVYVNQGDVAGTGIRHVRLVTLPGDMQHIRVSGAGSHLGLPERLGVSAALVQLVRTSGGFPFPGCWQAAFTTPRVSTSRHFRALR